MFDDLLNKAFGRRTTEPFQELLRKANDELYKGDIDEGDDIAPEPVGKKAKAIKVPKIPKVGAAAPKAPSATKVGSKKVVAPKLPMQQGGPSQAGTHTAMQVDSNTQPTSKMVIGGPNGGHRKTVHEGVKLKQNAPQLTQQVPKRNFGATQDPDPEDAQQQPEQNTPITFNAPEGDYESIKLKQTAPSLYVPGGEQSLPENMEGQDKGSHSISHVQHPSGGTVAVGHPEGSVPMAPVMDHKGKWYQENVQPGDFATFLAHTKDYGLHPFTTKILEKNPNGADILHMEHPNKAERQKGTPFPIHYSKIQHVLRHDPKNPGEHKTLMYPGELDHPDDAAPKNAVAHPKSSPKEMDDFEKEVTEHQKNRVDTVKKYIKPKDVIEFWMTNPTNGHAELVRGYVTNLAMPDTESPQGKSGKGGKTAQKAPEPTSIVAYTKDHGVVNVPFEHVHRFSQKNVNHRYTYVYNHNTGDWHDESLPQYLGNEEQLSEAKQAAPAAQSQATLPGGAVAGGATSESGVPEVKDGIESNIAHEEVKPLPQSDEKSRAEFVHNSGARWEFEHNGKVFFTDPLTERTHSIPVDELSEAAIKERLEQPKQKPQESFEEEPEPQFDIKTHWTHTFSPKQVSEVRGLLDKLDAHRAGNEVPPDVLAARHTLLHKQDKKAAMIAAMRIHEYLEAPNAIRIEHTPTEKDFKNKFFAEDLGDVSHSAVMDKLGTNNPSTSYLHKKQADAVSGLSKMAEELGMGDVATKLASINPKTDNRQVLHFYEQMLRSKANAQGLKLDSKIHIPSDEHIDMGKHLGEITEYINKQNLNNPLMTKKLQNLGFLMEHNPDNPQVQKLFNEMHNYGYEQGEQHPAHQFYTILNMLREKPPKNAPELLKRLEGRSNVMEQGVLSPEAVLQNTMEDLDKYGVKLKLPEPQQVNRTDSFKQRLDAMSAARQQAEGAKQIEKQLDSVATSPAGNKPVAGTDDEGATVPGVSPELTNKQSALAKIRKQIESKDANAVAMMEAMEQGSANYSPQDIAVISASIINPVQSLYEKYNQMADELTQQGVKVDEYKPKFKAMQEGKEQQMKENISESHHKQQSYAKDWFANQLLHSKNDLDVQRHHFLSRAKNQVPEVQNEIKQINQLLEGVMKHNQWNPIDAEQFKSHLAQTFAKQINNIVEEVRANEQMTMIPLQTALKRHEEMFGKSVSEMIAAEKTLVRRDISLALRKSFYNDKESPELRKATDLMASYFDDFVDAVINNYTAIPFGVRKSICRKLTKSLIQDVIKDNIFSATTMKDDFTAPLTDMVIKSMGREVAAMVTNFRIDAYDKPFLVVDLNKGMEKSSRKLEAFETPHNKPLARGIRLSPDDWFELLRGLEADLYKAGMTVSTVSPNRLRKFVADNDPKGLETFYNTNVQELNERLAEINSWV